jgi:hypothetical protein
MHWPSWASHPRVRATLHLLHFFFWFGLSIAAWDQLGPAWADHYRSSVSAPWSLWAGEVFVVARAHADPNVPALDTLVYVANRAHLHLAQTPVVSFGVSSRYTGYVDLAFLLSLLLATPMSWRRRLVVIPTGLALAQALIVLRVAISIVHEGQRQPALELTALPPTLAWLIATAHEGYVTNNLEAGLLTGLLLWSILAFPPETWARFVDGPTPPPAEPAAPAAPTTSRG